MRYYMFMIVFTVVEIRPKYVINRVGFALSYYDQL